MPKLIDKKKAQNEIALIGKYIAKTDAQKALVGRILFMIDNQPTIEPEVRHGRWKGWTTSKFTGKYKDYDEPEFKDYVYYTCSECYRKSAIQELYCPQCGAKMDGGAYNDSTRTD